MLGPNGSGKSTFARHLNALLFPDEGEIIVDGCKITEDEEIVWSVRSKVGMVFQNPDNQIVAGLVEEDVAFGPENLGLSREEIEKNITKALSDTSISQYRRKNPAHLSGGEKQRVAIAGVLAMRPKCIVLDEATAMLDPIGREKVLSTVHELNKKEGITIITITHYMDEARDADHVFVMDSGKIAMQGTPDEIFSKPDEIKKHRLDVPRAAITLEELLDKKKSGSEKQAALREPILEIKNVSYTYNPGHPEEKQALNDVSLSVFKGEKLFILGHTGSGKSTLVQMMNGLLKPDTGSVISGFGEGKSLRKHVGMVFQYPEYQLFEETVLKDVCFGPRNKWGSEKTEDEIEAIAKDALKSVGLSEDYFERSPFTLSGGEKRKAAIAGVLAMHPEVLIMDEPAAALDPAGKREVFELVDKLCKDNKELSVVIISHSLEDAYDYADRVVIMREGRII